MALATTATITGSTSALADSPHLQRIGRWLGVGWGDGYHVCRDGGIRPGADLPPHGYPKQFGPQKQRASCGEIYPPGTGVPATGAAACDTGVCDAQATPGAQPYANTVNQGAVGLSEVVEMPIEAEMRDDSNKLHRQIPKQQFTAPQSQLPAQKPAWATGETQTIQTPTIEVKKPPVNQEASPQKEIPSEELIEPDAQNVASPSDLTTQNMTLPESFAEGLLEEPKVIAPKVNRLPPVIRGNVSEDAIEPDYLNDEAIETLPPKARFRTEEEMRPTGAPQAIFDDSDATPFDDQTLLEERSQLIKESPLQGFAPPRVKLNPFFGTDDQNPNRPRYVQPRVAKRPVERTDGGWQPVVQPE